MSFKIASDKKQASLRRATPKRLGDFDINPTKEETIENLKKAKGAVDRKLYEANLRGLSRANPERMALVAECQRLQELLTQVGSRKKYVSNFASILIEVIKTKVTKVQFDSWKREAEERWRSSMSAENEESESTSRNV